MAYAGFTGSALVFLCTPSRTLVVETSVSAKIQHTPRRTRRSDSMMGCVRHTYGLTSKSLRANKGLMRYVRSTLLAQKCRASLWPDPTSPLLLAPELILSRSRAIHIRMLHSQPREAPWTTRVSGLRTANSCPSCQALPGQVSDIGCRLPTHPYGAARSRSRRVATM